MSDLRELYQEIILDHYRRPRNFGALDEPTHAAKGHNPLCGDRVAITLALDDAGAIRDIRFDGAGCAISTASASLMTEAVKGQPTATALQIFARFHELVTGASAESVPADAMETIDLGSLEALAGIRQLPVRVKCATLPWQALKAALLSEPRNVSTE